jgi:ferric-dicitrate binding protein FerR (iron transport regulator)
VTAVIKPGTDRAILKLGNGTTVVLDSLRNGIISKENGVVLNNAKDGILQYILDASSPDLVQTFNTVTTPRGGQYKVVLSDGTQAWLNAASSISYPVAFSHDARNVEVTGEVYFEVTKDKSRPFLVTAGTATVEVLGTRFDVNSYVDEPGINVSLLEGSVKVRAGDQSVTIIPGQQCVLDQAGNLSAGPADMEQVTAWKEGYFRWSNENIVTIMRQVSRWYDVEVVYEGDIRNENFGGIVARKDNIEKVLRIMESTGTVHFKTTGKKVTVMR